MPRKKKKATKPVAKNLKKDQILMVGMLFGNLVNVDVITTKLVTAVDEQQHVHHFQGRHESWVHIKSATNDLRTIIESGIKKYLQLYLTYNTGSEKYGRFLANWYTYVGSWAVGCLSNDHEQMTWNSITSDHEISVDDRSCLMHSLFSALFTSLSNIMDAAQSKLFTDVVSPATSVAATCTISDTSDDDESLYRIAGFALHSCIKLRKMMLKASKKRSRRTVLAKEIEVLEILCCTDKSAIPEKLKLLDRGGLTFPTSGLLPFLQHYSKEIKRHLNHHVLEDRGSDTFKDAKAKISRNSELFEEFKNVTVLSGKSFHLDYVKKIYKDLIRKMSNTICKSFLNSRLILETAKEGKSNDAQLSFRTSLKQYASNLATNIHL